MNVFLFVLAILSLCVAALATINLNQHVKIINILIDKIDVMNNLLEAHTKYIDGKIIDINNKCAYQLNSLDTTIDNIKRKLDRLEGGINNVNIDIKGLRGLLYKRLKKYLRNGR